MAQIILIVLALLPRVGKLRELQIQRTLDGCIQARPLSLGRALSLRMGFVHGTQETTGGLTSPGRAS